MLNKYKFIFVNPPGIGLSNYFDRSICWDFLSPIFNLLEDDKPLIVVTYSFGIKHLFDYLSKFECNDHKVNQVISFVPPVFGSGLIQNEITSLEMIEATISEQKALCNDDHNILNLEPSDIKIYFESTTRFTHLNVLDLKTQFNFVYAKHDKLPVAQGSK